MLLLSSGKNENFSKLDYQKNNNFDEHETKIFYSKFKVIDFKIGTFATLGVESLLVFLFKQSISFSATKAQNCHYFETIWT